MKQLIEITTIGFLIILSVILFMSNFIGFMIGGYEKCGSENRFVFNNWITGFGYKFTCDRNL